jgi:hypothetical protein
MMLNKDLDWDPETETFPNDEYANKLLSRPMRAPWDKVYEQYKA